MERWRDWLKQPHGIKLRRLHAWNAWLIMLLAVSGIVLYIPSIRGDLGVWRVVLKQVHIWLGVGSAIALGLYVPLIGKHLKQLRGRMGRLGNLWFVIALLLGWIASGIVLWQFRQLPTSWTGTALFWHDLLTWVGIPYAIYHSISRSRWLKREEQRERAAEKASKRAAADTTPGYAAYNPPLISRRTLVRLGVGAAMLLVIGPTFYRWLKGAFDGGGSPLPDHTSNDGNKMLPAPQPLAQSLTPAGGGAKGNFRIYTVTDFPEFTGDNWNFSITGLVGTPKTWTWEAFQSIPRKVQVSDFHCVTGWSVRQCTWEGIPLAQLLDEAGVDPKAKFVKLYSGDGVYTDCLSLEQARMEDVMVAMLIDGQLLPQKLGGPVRLIVPKMYAYKSVKWLVKIELVEKEHFGYWEVRGYDQDAFV